MCATSQNLPSIGVPSAPDPLPLADQATAHAALEKRLRRNGSRALKRAAKPSRMTVGAFIQAGGMWIATSP